jgi:Ca-activated chloride channel family protein
MGALERPPWVLAVDVGQGNESHRFAVVVRDPAGGSVESEVTTPRIATDEEVEVELQQLYVSVERGGERVLDLGREDFRIREDGAPQQTITFARGDIPFTAVILVDASQSMRGTRLATALAGASAFVEGMRELDEAKLLLFSDRLLHETPFTSFPAVLTVGLAGVEARGGTALHDALRVGVQRLAPRLGRKVVVLLSDGVDVESVLDMETVRAAVQESEALVYWLRLPHDGAHSSTWRDPAGHARQEQLLVETVRESGGRILPVAQLADARAAFESVLRELREHYVLGYYPPAGTSRRGWHRVEVEVDEPGVDVRARGRRVSRP